MDKLHIYIPEICPDYKKGERKQIVISTRPLETLDELKDYLKETERVDPAKRAVKTEPLPENFFERLTWFYEIEKETLEGLIGESFTRRLFEIHGADEEGNIRQSVETTETMDAQEQDIYDGVKDEEVL